MKKGLYELLKQFVVARGIKRPDIHSNEFMSEFYEWIKTRQAIGEEYLALIEEFNLPVKDSSCAEINKGVYDSITIDHDTTLITPYIEEKELYDPSRLIKYSLHVDSNFGFPEIKMEEGYRLIIPEHEVSTYITQNPYNQSLYKGLELLHNSNRNNIVFGVYGETSDKDIREKLNSVLRLRKELTRGYDETDMTTHGYYLYAIASEDREKGPLQRVRNR